eukprot:1098237-Karenia_brevis.AAC.1
MQDETQGLISAHDRFGNHCADALATRGAALHAVSHDVVLAAKSRKLLTTDIQRMMLEVTAARAELLQHMDLNLEEDT